MAFFTNRDINYLAAHTTLHQLAFSISGIFSAVFLFRAGISPAGIFLTFAAIFVLRLVFRPLPLFIVPVIGLRRALILGTSLTAVQYPLLALVNGPGIALAVFCVVSALENVIYWTCYHAFFAALGDVEGRGRQVGVRQALGAAAGIVGPALGGMTLSIFGPWAAFGTSALIAAAAIVPLLAVREPQFARTAPFRAYADAKTGVRLFITDGWITSSSMWTWHIILFQALDTRYDAFGGVLAAAALAGALGGMMLGHLIDMGHARHAAWLNATFVGGSLLLRAFCGNDPIVVTGVAIGATVIGGAYIPTLMTALYNEAKRAPCILRFHVAAEGGWDVGASMVCLIAAAICAFGQPLQVVILLALPMVALQAYLLDDTAIRANSLGSMAGVRPRE